MPGTHSYEYKSPPPLSTLCLRFSKLLKAVTKITGVFSCCGSARKLPGGDWVVSWGADHLISELTPDDKPVFELNFPTETSYRAPPVLPGVLSWKALDSAMDKMNPR